MKKLNQTKRGLLLLGVAALFSLGSTTPVLADDHHRDHDAWTHDSHGYWDDHHQHRSYEVHNHHHGYWRTNNQGIRLFVRID